MRLLDTLRIMGRIGDRLGKFDDDSAIYRADDPAQKVDWRRMAVAYSSEVLWPRFSFPAPICCSASRSGR